MRCGRPHTGNENAPALRPGRRVSGFRARLEAALQFHTIGARQDVGDRLVDEAGVWARVDTLGGDPGRPAGVEYVLQVADRGPFVVFVVEDQAGVGLTRRLL